MSSPNTFAIGCAAGFSGDRLDVAEPVVDTLIELGLPAAIMFETLAERTLALAQLARQRDPEQGYEPKLRELIEPILAKCVRHNIPILGNFGAANPLAAARLVAALGRESNLPPFQIAILEGDDIRVYTDSVHQGEELPPFPLEAAINNRGVPESWQLIESDSSLPANPTQIITANAYLGAAEIAEALRQGALVVVTGRVADPALALGPLLWHFDWALDDWDKLAAGILAGHLLECGSQVSGGYFADPGFKDVPDMANIGFPIAEVSTDGEIIIGKAHHTGGLVSEQTVKEQLLYEIHDPSAYLTPDVVLDITQVRVRELEPNRVLVQGAHGKPRPETLKTTLSFGIGWLGEGEISYAGPNALARAQLAAQVLRERIKRREIPVRYRIDLIGVASVHDSDDSALLASLPPELDHNDVRVRLAAAGTDKAAAENAAREVLALYCDGPAGGGGVRWNVTQRIGTQSYLVPREQVNPRLRFLSSHHNDPAPL